MKYRTLKVSPKDVIGAERFPLVTENNCLARILKVDWDSVPEGAAREDALACGWLDISPYWEEPYELVMIDGVCVYKNE